MVKASVIVLCRDRWKETRRCLEALERHTNPRLYEVLVYDNDSSDGTWAGLRQLARRWPRLRPFRNERNVAFAEAVNRGMRAARGEHLVWLNDDAIVGPRWLESLLEAAAPPSVGAAGPMTGHLAPPLQLTKPFKSGPRPLAVSTPFLGGFCFLLKRSALEAVGYLDERFVWGWEDMDYCLRLRQAGYALALARGVFVTHEGSRSMRKMPPPERVASDSSNRALLASKWLTEVPLAADLRELFKHCPSPWRPEPPTVSVVSIFQGSKESARRCLESVRRGADSSVEVLAATLDGGRRAGGLLREASLSWPAFRDLGRWDGVPYAYAANLAASESRGKYLAFLSDDAVMSPGWLGRLLAAFEGRPAAGVVAPGAKRGVHDAFFVRQGCLVVPRRAFSDVGGFDDRFMARLGAEDFCLRARQRGYHVLQAGGVRARRQAAATPPMTAQQRAGDRRLLDEKWAGHPVYAGSNR